MIFAPAAQHFADFRSGKSWKTKLAKRGAKLAYRNYLWTRGLYDTIRANAFAAKCDAERKARAS